MSLCSSFFFFWTHHVVHRTLVPWLEPAVPAAEAESKPMNLQGSPRASSLPAAACWSWPHHRLFPTPHSMHPIRSLKSTLAEVVPPWKYALCCKSRLPVSPDSWLLTFRGPSLVVGLLCKADATGSMSTAVRLWKQPKQSCVRCQGSLRTWESPSAISELPTEQPPPEWGLGYFFPFYVCVYKGLFCFVFKSLSLVFFFFFLIQRIWLVFYFFIYLLIYLAASGLSCGTWDLSLLCSYSLVAAHRLRACRLN